MPPQTHTQVDEEERKSLGDNDHSGAEEEVSNGEDEMFDRQDEDDEEEEKE